MPNSVQIHPGGWPRIANKQTENFINISPPPPFFKKNIFWGRNILLGFLHNLKLTFSPTSDLFGGGGIAVLGISFWGIGKLGTSFSSQKSSSRLATFLFKAHSRGNSRKWPILRPLAFPGPWGTTMILVQLMKGQISVCPEQTWQFWPKKRAPQNLTLSSWQCRHKCCAISQGRRGKSIPQ